MTFGERLVFYRKQKGMLKKDLAEKSEISPTALNYYEKDKREPSVLIIKRLARVLQITGDELLGMNEDENIANVNEGEYNNDEKELLQKYNSLNSEGQSRIQNYIDDLMSTGKYKTKVMTPNTSVETSKEPTPVDLPAGFRDEETANELCDLVEKNQQSSFCEYR